MTTKLTLTVDDTVINQAKKYAKLNGRSLSDVVETYLKTLSATLEEEENINPRIKKLMGVISLPEEFDYKKELSNAIAKKYK